MRSPAACLYLSDDEARDRTITSDMGESTMNGAREEKKNRKT